MLSCLFGSALAIFWAQLSVWATRGLWETNQAWGSEATQDDVLSLPTISLESYSFLHSEKPATDDALSIGPFLYIHPPQILFRHWACSFMDTAHS